MCDTYCGQILAVKLIMFLPKREHGVQHSTFGALIYFEVLTQDGSVVFLRAGLLNGLPRLLQKITEEKAKTGDEPWRRVLSGQFFLYTKRGLNTELSDIRTKDNCEIFEHNGFTTSCQNVKDGLVDFPYDHRCVDQIMYVQCRQQHGDEEQVNNYLLAFLENRGGPYIEDCNWIFSASERAINLLTTGHFLSNHEIKMETHQSACSTAQ